MRQSCKQLEINALEEIGEPSEGEALVRLRRPGRQDSKRPRFGEGSRRAPERRLADPRLPLEDEDSRAVFQLVEKLRRSGELPLAAHDRVGHDSSVTWLGGRKQRGAASSAPLLHGAHAARRMGFVFA
jgi:hypothetical protein